MFSYFEIFLLCLICSSELINCQLKLVPEVITEKGLLRGKAMTSRSGRKYFAFQGIRYGERPERFKLVEPVKSWEGARDAFEPGPSCLHSYPSTASSLMHSMGSEDCFFLNVFTPQDRDGSKLPVMFFIHGGAFIFGSGNEFGSEYLMDEDIVFVTFNYRLGVFGFLYNEDDLIPGNLGLKDQVAALQWVQRNIHHFGGDPSRVTIFGQSAGSASAHLMMFSPMATGLFHGAILQSGFANSPWAINKNPKSDAERLATALGCPTGSPSAMVECLRIMDGDTIAEIQTVSRWSAMLQFHWAPVVEKQPANNGDVFLSEHPQVLLARKQVVNSVPIIMGINRNEGAAVFSGFILSDPEATHEMNANWNHIAPLTLLYLTERRQEVATPRLDEASLKIRRFYFGHYPVDASTEQRLTDLFSDRYFLHGLVTSARVHCQLSPTFLYAFTFTAGFSFLHAVGITNFDPPSHADDLPYIFPLRIKPTLSRPMEIQFSKHWVRLWTSFAQTGRPEGTWGSTQTWPMMNSTDSGLAWYLLDVDTKVIKDPFRQRMKFWDGLLANELRDN